MSYDTEMSLGDILKAAREREMVNVDKVVNFIRAGRDTGRSDREVLEMLTGDEITAILERVVTIYPAPERRTVNARVENSHKIERKIDAIKMVREQSGVGLLEAKQFVEATRTLPLTKAEYNAINEGLRTQGDVFLTN